MLHHKEATKTGLSFDSPPGNSALWPCQWLLSGLCGSSSWPCSSYIPAGTCRQFGGCLQQHQVGRELVMLEICYRGTEPWQLLVLKPRHMKAVSGPRHRLHPHLTCAADMPDGSERAAGSWATLKHRLVLLGAECFHKNTGSEYTIKPLFLLTSLHLLAERPGRGSSRGI